MSKFYSIIFLILFTYSFNLLSMKKEGDRAESPRERLNSYLSMMFGFQKKEEEEFFLKDEPLVKCLDRLFNDNSRLSRKERKWRKSLGPLVEAEIADC